MNVDYPIYGLITKILDDSPNNLWVELNYHMKVKINLLEDQQEKLDIILQRVFEVGIFILQFTKKYEDLPENKYLLEAECSCIIFGKQEEKQYH